MRELFEKIAGRKLWSFLLIVVAGSCLNFPGTASLPLMDRDEPKFAQATWEMMETEQFTIPFFNKGYRFDKPPLTYWWMRIHYHIFGKTELAARMHSIFAGILTAWVIYLFGRFLFTPTAGLLSALGWLSCLQVLIHSRLCVADMPMLLGVTITMYAIARLLFAETEPRQFGRDYWLLVFGLAFGFLAKGPVAWIIPILALLLWWWPLGRQGFAWRRLQPVTSLLIATAIVALWGIKALIETRGGYWDVGVGEHVVKRGVSAFNGRVNIPIVYYLVTGIISLLPWSAFLPGAVFTTKTELRENRKRSFLTAWFLAPFLVFALYATQLPHYILPGFPGLFLLLFASASIPRLDTAWRKNWFDSVLWAMGVVSVLILLGGIFKIFPEPMNPVNPLLLLVGALLGLVGVAFPLAIRLVQTRLSRWPLLIVIAVAAVSVAHVLTVEIRKIHPIILLKNEGVFLDHPDTRYVAQGFSEPSWVFYEWNGEPWLLTGSVDQGVEFLQEDGPRAGIFLTEEWRIGEDAVLAELKGEEPPYLRDQREQVEAAFGNGGYEIVKIEGLNIARTSWVKYWFVRKE